MKAAVHGVRLVFTHFYYLFQSTCEVEIFVRDVNDNAPRFERNHYTATVTEHASEGTQLKLVRHEK